MRYALVRVIDREVNILAESDNDRDIEKAMWEDILKHFSQEEWDELYNYPQYAKADFVDDGDLYAWANYKDSQYDWVCVEIGE